ncbi:MAG: glucosamine-6-phosphate deaminase [Myxococcota bacterium]
MRVVIESTPPAAASTAAARIAELVRGRPSCVLGLAAGATMVPIYEELARACREGVRFSGVTTFDLDEYVGISAEDPRSFAQFMKRHLFGPAEFQPANTNAPDGLAGDLWAECEAYEEKIRRAGGIDLQLLGLGVNGHLAFNEPGSSLASRTRVKTLTRSTLEANEAELGDLAEAPRLSITMGLGTILSARTCLLVAVGQSKAGAVAGMVEGPVTAQVPASALQLHPETVVVLDDAAASQLANLDYYREVEALQRELEARR